MKAKLLLFPALALAFMIGCDRWPGDEREPLPTEHEIYQQYRDALDVILVRGHPTEAERKQAVDAFRTALETDLSEEAWYPRREVKRYQDARRFAKQRITEDILSQLQQSRDLGGWRIVLGAIEAYWVLKPDELLYSELYKHAQKMAAMPKLTNKGYKIDEADGREVVIFEVDDPKTGTTMTVRAVEGQVFYNNRFKLEEIIGKHAAYKIRYLDVENHVFMLESTRRGVPELPDTL